MLSEIEEGVGSGQWAVGSGQLAVGSWQWAVGSWRLAVGSGQFLRVEKIGAEGCVMQTLLFSRDNFCFVGVQESPQPTVLSEDEGVGSGKD